MKSNFSFYKENDSDKVWWVDIPDDEGTFAFSFDKKKIYYLFGDYPDKLTEEELEIFNKENPYWVNFFSV